MLAITKSGGEINTADFISRIGDEKALDAVRKVLETGDIMPLARYFTNENSDRIKKALSELLF